MVFASEGKGATVMDAPVAMGAASPVMPPFRGLGIVIESPKGGSSAGAANGGASLPIVLEMSYL